MVNNQEKPGTRAKTLRYMLGVWPCQITLHLGHRHLLILQHRRLQWCNSKLQKEAHVVSITSCHYAFGKFVQ